MPPPLCASGRSQVILDSHMEDLEVNERGPLSGASLFSVSLLFSFPSLYARLCRRANYRGL